MKLYVIRKWKILSEITGYSAIYCRRVVDRKRSKNSKDRIYKYKEFENLLSS